MDAISPCLARMCVLNRSLLTFFVESVYVNESDRGQVLQSRIANSTCPRECVIARLDPDGATAELHLCGPESRGFADERSPTAEQSADACNSQTTHSIFLTEWLSKLNDQSYDGITRCRKEHRHLSAQKRLRRKEEIRE